MKLQLAGFILKNVDQLNIDFDVLKHTHLDLVN